MGPSNRAGDLIRIAREDELYRHGLLLESKAAKAKKNREFMEGFRKKHAELEKRRVAAGVLLWAKFREEMEGRLKAKKFVQKFLAEYTDKNGNIQRQRMTGLQRSVENLDDDQRKWVRTYAGEILLDKEYPKTDVPLYTMNEAASGRSPASSDKRDAGHRGGLHVLLWELQ